MKNVIKVLSVGLLIAVILFLLEQLFRFVSGEPMIINLRLLAVFGFFILYSVPLSIVNGYFFNYINHKANFLEKSRFRFFIGLLGSVFISLFTVFIIRMIHRVLIDGIDYQEFFRTENLQFYFITILITLFISLFFHAFEFYKIHQEKKVKEQKIIAGTASAQFESLKNQIDPHFLFNSLNVLTSLIEENPDHAQKFTTSLSKIYRYVLEQKDKELVSVEEELRFAVSYINLLKMRFENSVFYEISENISNPEAKVVPLSLQLLLENTVKHNVVSAKRPLNIRIYESNGYLVVENDIQKKEVFSNRKGVGLENIINRYAIITKRNVHIEENNKIFRVSLPILTKQISIMETKNQIDQENAYFRAKQRVKELKEFYGHLISYCCVIPALFVINYVTYWDFQWFWFPMLGWGLGLSIHGFSVFGYGVRWEEKKIREIMEQEEEELKTWK
ncbi:MAG TPA: 2TM domain-containing protein [Salinimicrobium sp.]|nr:2TM domain-containing protein [Salinimicrobium sp.]